MQENESTIPDWVNETPEADYRIFMGDGEGGEVQGVELTREEYEQLKQRLAQMRGHITPETETESSRPLMERIGQLHDSSLKVLAAAVQAFERYSGSTSPVEEFVHDVCLLYQIGHLNPDNAERKVEDFRQNLTDMVRYTSIFARTNPREFKKICAQLPETETKKETEHA